MKSWDHLSTPNKQLTAAKPQTKPNPMLTLTFIPIFAAAGYSAIYLLGGGGLFGALMIFIIAKMFGQ